VVSRAYALADPNRGEVIHGFAPITDIVPLVMFTFSRARTVDLVAPRWLTVFAGVIASVVISLNVKLLSDIATG
jgi:manganese transport protein